MLLQARGGSVVMSHTSVNVRRPGNRRRTADQDGKRRNWTGCGVGSGPDGAGNQRAVGRFWASRRGRRLLLSAARMCGVVPISFASTSFVDIAGRTHRARRDRSRSSSMRGSDRAIAGQKGGRGSGRAAFFQRASARQEPCPPGMPSMRLPWGLAQPSTGQLA
jgi:hypothetical protein